MHVLAPDLLLTTALLISTVFQLHPLLSTPISSSQHLELFEVRVEFEGDLLGLDVGDAHDAIRFGLWGFCHDGTTIHLPIHDIQLKGGCKRTYISAINVNSQVAEEFHLENAVKMIRGGAASFKSFFFFLFFMSLFAFLLSLLRFCGGFRMSWPKSQRTITIEPGWAAFAIGPSTIGAFATLLVTCILHGAIDRRGATWKANFGVASLKANAQVYIGVQMLMLNVFAAVILRFVSYVYIKRWGAGPKGPNQVNAVATAMAQLEVSRSPY